VVDTEAGMVEGFTAFFRTRVRLPPALRSPPEYQFSTETMKLELKSVKTQLSTFPD